MSALDVGFLDSLAWRDGGRLHLVLHLPEVAGEAVGTPVEVRFRDGERRVRVTGRTAAHETGTMVEVDLEARRVAGGLWRIAVRIGDAEGFTRVQARLLVRREQPVALLPGPEPRTRLAEPAPRTSTASTAPADLARRVVRGVRRRLPH